MTKDEIDAVAQAITDAHAHEPGQDRSGRLELAKSIIAAVDALQAMRGTKKAPHAAAPVEPPPQPTPVPIDRTPASPPAPQPTVETPPAPVGTIDAQVISGPAARLRKGKK